MQCCATWAPNTLLCVWVAQADVNLCENLDKKFEWLSMNACGCAFMRKGVCTCLLKPEHMLPCECVCVCILTGHVLFLCTFSS